MKVKIADAQLLILSIISYQQL